MAGRRTLRLSLLAATAAVSAGAAAPALAADPAPVEIIAAADSVAEEAKPAAAIPVRTIGLAALATAALAGLVKLFGANRILNMVASAGPIVAKAAAAAAEAPAKAAKAVGEAVASPFKFLALVAGLALFAMTGVSVFDIDWAAGLAVGASLVGVVWAGVARTKTALSAIRIRRKQQ